jgi:hypothetical protein
MMRRLVWLVSLLLVAAACSYESSGTTTTSLTLDDEEPVATTPTEIVAGDQRSEGSSVVVESLTLPAAGWVVARLDSGGSPGEVIGISELISKGTITEVPVPFLIPVADTTTVHLTVHIDMDGDGEFLFEPPDSFIDVVATTAGGEPATVTLTITLLPPLGPASALLDPQVSDGTTVVVAGGLLPAPGFLAVHASDGGEPGALLGVSRLFPAGEVGAVTVALDEPLAATGPLFAVAWVDRDENGLFTPGPDGDEMAVTEDGLLAAGSAEVTVIRREPAALVVADQDVEGGVFVISSLQVPAPGLIEILSDASGAPGNRLGVVLVNPGTVDDLEVPLPAGVGDGDRLWLRLWVDFDQSGSLTAADLRALTELDGDPIEESFVVSSA